MVKHFADNTRMLRFYKMKHHGKNKHIYGLKHHQNIFNEQYKIEDMWRMNSCMSCLKLSK